jgi:hypothetical protein
MSPWKRLLLALALPLFVASCGLSPARQIPEGFDLPTARPLGMDGLMSTRRDNIIDPEEVTHPGPILALSAGGVRGAFGAGVLVGWTATGERPEFSVVTGVSTGALLSLFAFLGPDQDADLKTAYTTVKTRDLVSIRPVSALLGTPSFTSAEGFREQIEKYLDEEALARIEEGAAQGRKLIVATTNLDAQAPRYWDITAIAASGHPDRLELIRNVIQASAAIPTLFPPVLIPVFDTDGRTFPMLHGDGGVTEEYILLELGDRVLSGRKSYVVLNQFERPEFKATDVNVIGVLGATTGANLAQLYRNETRAVLAAERSRGYDVSFATIPAEFDQESEEGFDPVYMTSLFNLGRRAILRDALWIERPAIAE